MEEIETAKAQREEAGREHDDHLGVALEKCVTQPFE
jgi:hypothetical protein